MWKIDEAAAATPYGKGKLAGTLQTRAPFALDATVTADGVAAEPRGPPRSPPRARSPPSMPR
jgi:hypothetical protein